MRIAGIDLSGKDKKASGFCILDISENGSRKAMFSTPRTDEEILMQCQLSKPGIIAIDAPLSKAKNGYLRFCDEELMSLGVDVLPQSLSGMASLVERGISLNSKIPNADLEIIEISVRATKKVLGLEEKGMALQKQLSGMLSGSLSDRMYSQDELDSAVAALAAVFYSSGKTRILGDPEGAIILPEV